MQTVSTRQPMSDSHFVPSEKIHSSLRIVEQNKDQRQIVFAFLLVLLWGWWACGCRTQPKSDILYSICKRKCVWVVRTYITINYRGALSLHLIKKNNHRREKKTKTNRVSSFVLDCKLHSHIPQDLMDILAMNLHAKSNQYCSTVVTESCVSVGDFARIS